MSIITLTSDLGYKDHYLPSLKASIFSQLENVNIIDISHEIESFNILQAAYVLKNCFKDFPRDTVHIIAIDDELSVDNDHIAVYAHEQYFIGADNGFFSILLDDFKPDKIISLNINQKNDFKVKKNLLMPVIETNSLRGIVTYIDSYGNAITNVDLKTFQKYIGNRNFSILFGREDEEIKKISTKYKEVEIAEKLAIFNSNNYLQISINQGNANTLLGLNFFDTIRIDF